MPLSESALKEIRSELTALHDLKVKLDERVKALEAILVPLDFGQAALPFLGHSQNSNGQREIEADHKEQPRGANASTGLRAAILDVLRHHGPMRAPDVAVTLGQRGFVDESSTPLPTRVYNDLWRMSQRGIVANKDGAFSLK